MSWQAIAKKDFRDSVRAKTLWALIIIFAILFGGLAFLAVDNSGSNDVLGLLAGFTAFISLVLFVPVAGLLLSIKSVVRERESGTISVLLSLPHSRGDVVVGKFLGRSIVMAVATIIGFIPGLLILYLEIQEGLGALFAFLLSIILIGIMFVGIGVGFSALVNTETQATVGSIAIFFILFLWPVVLDQIVSLFDAELPDFVGRFWLFIMLSDITEALAPQGDGLGGASAVADSSVNPSIFMQNWFAFVILALWIAVPLVLGYARFKSVDL